MYLFGRPVPFLHGGFLHCGNVYTAIAGCRIGLSRDNTAALYNLPQDNLPQEYRLD